MLSDKSQEIQLEKKLLKLALHHNERLMYWGGLKCIKLPCFLYNLHDTHHIHLLHIQKLSTPRKKGKVTKTKERKVLKADALRWTSFPGSNIRARHVIAPNFTTHTRNAYELVYTLVYAGVHGLNNTQRYNAALAICTEVTPAHLIVLSGITYQFLIWDYLSVWRI